MSPSSRDSSPDLTEQAIEWFVLLHSDEAGTEQHRQFAAWLARSPAHGDAYAAVERLYGDMRRAAQAAQMTCAVSTPEPVKAARTTRLDSDAATPEFSGKTIHRKTLWNRYGSRFLQPGLAAAAAWLFAILLILPEQFHLSDAWLSDHYTRTGEQREIRLADGSQVLLNTNSAVTVDYGPRLRRVRLLHGQARFEVAADAARPFEVISDDLKARALGTVFEVYRKETGEISVTVQEHAVSVTAENGAATVVEQGQRIWYRPGHGLEEPEAVNLKLAAGWQQRRIMISDRPLGELLAEVDRYRLGRVFITDPELAKLPVTGVFSLDDPDAILESVTKALALRSTQLGPWWITLHR